MKTTKKPKLFRAQFSIGHPRCKPVSIILFIIADREADVEDYIRTQAIEQVVVVNDSDKAFIKTLNIKQQRMDGLISIRK